MSTSERPNSGHEELAISVKGTKRVSQALITVLLSTVCAGGASYGMNAAARERSEIDRRLAEGAAQAQQTERKLLIDRICTLEYEIVEAEIARVSLSAADAEPVRARKAQTAALAAKRFKESAEEWPCPSTAAELAARVRRPLHVRAQSALPATVPGR